MTIAYSTASGAVIFVSEVTQKQTKKTERPVSYRELAREAPRKEISHLYIKPAEPVKKSAKIA